MTNNDTLTYITQSFDLKRQGYYKQAIEMLYKALSVEGNNVEILFQLADLYFLLDNEERTQQYLEKALELKPEHLDSMKLQAKLEVKRGELEKARDTYLKILEISNSSENAVEYIKILNSLKDFKSIQNYKESNEITDVDLVYEIASAYANNYKITEAITMLESLVLKGEEASNLLILLGVLYYKNVEPYKSKAVFQILNEREDNDICLHHLGLFAIDEGKYMDAVTYLQKALILKPNNAQYAFDLANAYYLNGWIEEAVKFFNDAILKEPENKEYLYALAYLYYRIECFDKSKIELNRIFKIDKEYLPAKTLHALLKLEEKDVLGAKFELEKLIDFESSDDFALFVLAKIYLELGQYDKAKTYMMRAISLKGDNLIYLCEYTNIVFEEKNYEFAQKLCDKFKEMSPNYYDNWVLQAKIYDAQENCMELFNTAQKLIELDLNRYEGYYYNALALFMSDDISFAIESMKKAISLNVNNANLYVLMSEFYQAIGQNKEALLYMDEASNIDPSAKNKELYMRLAAVVRRESRSSI